MQEYSTGREAEGRSILWGEYLLTANITVTYGPLNHGTSTHLLLAPTRTERDGAVAPRYSLTVVA